MTFHKLTSKDGEEITLCTDERLTLAIGLVLDESTPGMLAKLFPVSELKKLHKQTANKWELLKLKTAIRIGEGEIEVKSGVTLSKDWPKLRLEGAQPN